MPDSSHDSAPSPNPATPSNDDHNRSQSPHDDHQPSMNGPHPITYSGMPMHMYPFPPGLVQPQPARTKRRQVKNACTNCQKACKKCDDARPCLRCVKYGIAEECVDSQRKERQKGIKRGPYKKRDGKDRASGNADQPLDMAAVQPGLIPAAIAATSATPPMPYTLPMGYPAGFFGMPTAAPGKPGEAPTYTYPAAQYYLAPFPMPVPPQAPGQEGEAATPYPAGFYPITFAPYGAQPYATPYMVPAPQPVPPSGQQQQQPPQQQPMQMQMQQMPMPQMQMQMPMQVAGMPQMQMQMPMTAMPGQAIQYAAYPPPPPPSHHYVAVGGNASAKNGQREGGGGAGGPTNGSTNGGGGGEMGSQHGHHQHQHPQQQMVDSAGGRRDVRMDQYGGRVNEGMSGAHGKGA